MAESPNSSTVNGHRSAARWNSNTSMAQNRGTTFVGSFSITTPCNSVRMPSQLVFRLMDLFFLCHSVCINNALIRISFRYVAVCQILSDCAMKECANDGCWDLHEVRVESGLTFVLPHDLVSFRLFCEQALLGFVYSKLRSSHPQSCGFT